MVSTIIFILITMSVGENSKSSGEHISPQNISSEYAQQSILTDNTQQPPEIKQINPPAQIRKSENVLPETDFEISTLEDIKTLLLDLIRKVEKKGTRINTGPITINFNLDTNNHLFNIIRELLERRNKSNMAEI